MATEPSPVPFFITTEASSTAILTIARDGAVHWRGREVVGDDEFKQAMMDVSRCLRGDPAYQLGAPVAQPAQTDDEDGPISHGWQTSVAHGHAGYGVYAHMTEYPEEGAMLLHALPVAQPQAEVMRAVERAREALPEFRQHDDYLLAHGASVMSEDSHEIIHIDTFERIVRAALTASALPTEPTPHSN